MSTEQGSERLPPQNREAEQSLLGSMLRDNAVIADVINIVREESFYTDAHRKIYRGITSLFDKAHPVDLITLADWLKQEGFLEDVGKYPYLSVLWECSPTAANAVYYARIVRDKGVVRNLIHAGTEILRDCYDQAQPADELLEGAERKIMEIAQMGVTGQTYTLQQALNEAYDRIDVRSQGDHMSLSGLSTGFLDLDAITAGLQNSELIILAARPSVGKCLAFDSEIVLENGEVVTIEEVYRRRQARLLTLQDNLRFAVTEPSAFVDDGVKPVYRVTTRLGRHVEATLSHPFLTRAGWRKLAELQPGERIAVPHRVSMFGQETLPEDEIKQLASASNDFEKTIPAIVFRLERTQVALFLNYLFAVDGWVTIFAGGHTHLGYTTGCEKLARQIQHLLLRLGVVASLRKRSENYRNTRQFYWRLVITNPRSLRSFITEVGIFGKEDVLAKVSKLLENRTAKSRTPMPWTSGGVYPRRQTAGINPAARPSINCGDVYWDEIVAIDPVGHKQVYDLTVPQTHNFVANDICVHNTAFSLNIVRHIITAEKQPVFFVSLEQSRIELAERLLCSHAKVDSHKLRKGHLSGDDMSKLIEAGDQLRQAQLFIDDSPGQGMLRISANARRLKMRHNIRLVVIDYLQLIEPDNRRDPRQEQVAQISRRLKFLARELNIPVMSLAQVNRSSEDRQDHRPRLSDLRESGCLTGDTLVTLADTGKRVPIRHLLGSAKFNVWALDEVTYKLKPAKVSNVFSTGIKPVFRLETRLGRTIRATGNHQFRTLLGWKRLDALRVGERIALPRLLSGRTQTAACIRWDEIRTIQSAGVEEVYDMTVPGPANFVANDIVVHNSIEQDADTVLLLHRPELHEPGQHEGVIEVIIGKQRNGPTGEVTLTYLKQYMRYENFAVEPPFGYGA